MAQHESILVTKIIMRNDSEQTKLILVTLWGFYMSDLVLFKLAFFWIQLHLMVEKILTNFPTSGWKKKMLFFSCIGGGGLNFSVVQPHPTITEFCQSPGKICWMAFCKLGPCGQYALKWELRILGYSRQHILIFKSLLFLLCKDISYYCTQDANACSKHHYFNRSYFDINLKEFKLIYR